MNGFLSRNFYYVSILLEAPDGLAYLFRTSNDLVEHVVQLTWLFLVDGHLDHPKLGSFFLVLTCGVGVILENNTWFLSF